MARIASESNLVHPSIDRASALGVLCARIEMFAPNEGSSLVECSTKNTEDQEPARQGRYAIRLDSLLLSVIRVPRNLDSLGGIG